MALVNPGLTTSSLTVSYEMLSASVELEGPPQDAPLCERGSRATALQSSAWAAERCSRVLTIRLIPAEFPARTESTDANGITTVVEYKMNDEGKKVKVRWGCRLSFVMGN